MKVRTKLTVGFLVIVLLIWATVFVASNTYTEIHEEFELLKEDTIPGAVAMAEMEEKAQEIKAWTFVYMIKGNVVRKGKPVKEWVQESTESLERLAREYREQAVAVAPEELENKAKQLSSVVMGIINLKDQGVELDELVEKREEAFRPIFMPLVELIEEHKAAQMAMLAESEEAVHKAHTSGEQALLLSAGLITLMAAAVVFVTARSIVKPLRALQRGTEIIGKGNLDYKVGTRAKDEIGQLSRAFDQMTEELGKKTTSIDNLNKEITERKKAEEELRKYREQLEEMVEERTRKLREAHEGLLRAERLATLGQFSGSVSHELRNPLGVIDSSVYFLKSRLKDADGKTLEHLERIRSSVSNSTAIIESLLNLTRMKEPQVEKLDLAAVVSKAIATSKVPVAVNVVRDFPDGEVPVNADGEQLRMAFKNVIRNAAEAMDGKGTLTITIRALAGGQVEVTFVDTGPGIAPENQEKVFQPLFSTRAKGIGFGLSISKMVIEKHAGTIEAKSEQGEGATFIIRLPLSAVKGKEE